MTLQSSRKTVTSAQKKLQRLNTVMDSPTGWLPTSGIGFILFEWKPQVLTQQQWSQQQQRLSLNLATEEMPSAI